jgi:dihydrodipicolinate synthase/N-acetylneuraminate lyase
MKKLEGVLCLLATPFNEDYMPNEETMIKQIEWVVEKGAHGIIPTGSVGEFTHLTLEERKRIYEVCIDSVKDSVVTLAGTGTDTTLHALELTKYVQDLGYDGAMVAPPFYWRSTEEEIYDHYKRIADATSRNPDFQIMVYNPPALTKFYMSTKFVKKLAKIKGITSIKDSDANILRTLYLRDEIDVFRVQQTILFGLLLGAKGACVAPFSVPLCLECYNACKQGKLDKARDLQIQILKGTVTEEDIAPEAASAYLGRWKITNSLVLGIDMGPPRLPYRHSESGLSLKETSEKIRNTLKKYKVIE